MRRLLVLGSVVAALAPAGCGGDDEDTAQSTPFSVTVVARSSNSVSAPLLQTFNKSTYSFISWSDGGQASHPITAPDVNTTYTATYRKR